ncbi:MAG: hypothetical protein M1388_02195 [Thaumarchaeota archaeon]|nr:hypothetical protein [Nitrososphaerota archaeon]
MTAAHKEELIDADFVIELLGLTRNDMIKWAKKNRVKFLRDKEGAIVYYKNDIARALARQTISEDRGNSF